MAFAEPMVFTQPNGNMQLDKWPQSVGAPVQLCGFGLVPV